MTRNPFRAAFIILAVAAIAAGYLILGDYLTIENLRETRYVLLFLVKERYLLSVGVYIAFHVATSFFLPGVIVLTIAGGFLFGAFWGSLYTLFGITLGSCLAFLVSRYLIGEWVQNRYSEKLERFNTEMKASGYLYLLTLRITPVLPAFVTNYLAGLTGISLWTFMWTTFVGVMPGTAVYSYAGRQFKGIESIRDFISLRLTISLLFMGALALLPLTVRYFKRKGA